MARDDDGLLRVSPFKVAGCDGVGRTLDEASSQTAELLRAYLATQREGQVFVPLFDLDAAQLADGEVVRIRLDLP